MKLGHMHLSTAYWLLQIRGKERNHSLSILRYVVMKYVFDRMLSLTSTWFTSHIDFSTNWCRSWLWCSAWYRNKIGLELVIIKTSILTFCLNKELLKCLSRQANAIVFIYHPTNCLVSIVRNLRHWPLSSHRLVTSPRSSLRLYPLLEGSRQNPHNSYKIAKEIETKALSEIVCTLQ